MFSNVQNEIQSYGKLDFLVKSLANSHQPIHSLDYFNLFVVC